jgi:cytochrome P450
MLHPEVQRKGHEEISRVCDSSQLPSYDDVDSLPYVTAIALEVLRWTAAVPTGIMSFRFAYDQVILTHILQAYLTASIRTTSTTDTSFQEGPS